MEIDSLGRIQISHDMQTRRQLMRYLNDNVYQNIDKKVMGVKKYHNTGHETKNLKQKIKKDPLVFEEKEEIVDELMHEKFGEQNK